MQALVDTNVVLDILLKRPLWLAEASALAGATDEGRLIGHVTASSVTDVFYLARRLVGPDAAHAAVRVCLSSFVICTVDGDVLLQAAMSFGSDIEDNLQVVCAVRDNLDAIVTRDPAGFRHSTVPVLSPSEAWRQLGS